MGAEDLGPKPLHQRFVEMKALKKEIEKKKKHTNKANAIRLFGEKTFSSNKQQLNTMYINIFLFVNYLLKSVHQIDS